VRYISKSGPTANLKVVGELDTLRCGRRACCLLVGAERRSGRVTKIHLVPCTSPVDVVPKAVGCWRPFADGQALALPRQMPVRGNEQDVGGFLAAARPHQRCMPIPKRGEPHSAELRWFAARHTSPRRNAPLTSQAAASTVLMLSALPIARTFCMPSV
jgi:hypothetical protein